MSLRIKICGITQPEQGRAIADLGATALGFICAPTSPRYVLPEQIRAMTAVLPTDATTGELFVDRIGVFVNESLEKIQHTIDVGNLNGVQLHGDEPPEFCDAVRSCFPQIEVIKAFRIRMTDDLRQVDKYCSVVDAVLLDAYHPNLAGGTGQTLNWQTLQQFKPGVAWFLAGGLTPANICSALSQVTPDGIDLSSGVERSPGDKDLEKVGQLFVQLGSLNRG